ncbi:MAG: glutamate--tRNA ligase [Verrucomicrobiales bacterium]|nr:glutamate--tRNA ligase [Verrucomicrobiales bacterium]
MSSATAPLRVRFAPSPTGYLHIGGARTALFNWLFARHTGATFVLRIEDTDAARNTQEATDVILRGLRWLGLDWDEGPVSGDPAGPSRGDRGPYFQSRRGDSYRRRVAELVDKGLAYEKEGAVRFRMRRDPVVIRDTIIGDISRALTDREQEDPDFVIVRSDGLPVFHFVNVVDDIEMGITHVVRGEDHVSNTAKHIALFQAFGVEPPVYAHIPLILNPDGSKMSKRDQGASIQTYIDDGYLPDAVTNYLCLLGWTPKDGGEFFTKEEAARSFELGDVHRSNARFDMKKLEHFHFEHTRRLPAPRFAELAIQTLDRLGFDLSGFPASYTASALATVQEKGKLFRELPTWVDFYFLRDDALAFDPEARAKALVPAAVPLLRQLRERFAALPEFTAATLETALKQLATDLGLKAGPLVQPCRVACTGRSVGPSLYHLMGILGRERVLARLDLAAKQIPAG